METEPNKERLRLWVAALREESRTQGRGTLCRIEADSDVRQQCCLHVMIEVARDNGGPNAQERLRPVFDLQLRNTPVGSMVDVRAEHRHTWQSNLPPLDVVRWFGFPAPTGNADHVVVNIHEAADCLPYVNDEQDTVCSAFGPNGETGTHYIHASSANDSLGWSFAQIADSVEQLYDL